MTFLDHDDNLPDSGSMFARLCMPRPGSWSISSASDPRWSDSGRSAFVGGGVMPEDARKAIEAKTALYGPPPADLEWGYMKD